jgi:hypothetical protein
VSDGASAGRLAAMRDRAVALAAAEAQQAAEAAAAEASAAQADADQALLDAAAADGRVDDVLAGVEDFTAISVGGDDKFGFLDTVASDVLPTEGLAPEAATQSAGDTQAAVLTLTGATDCKIVEKAITTTGGEVEVTASFFINCEDSSNFTITYRITRTTGMSTTTFYTQVIDGNAMRDAGGDYKWIKIEPLLTSDEPAAGTHTYAVWVQLGASLSTMEVENRVLRLLEIKR